MKLSSLNQLGTESGSLEREIELKLLLDDRQERALRSGAAVRTLATTRPHTRLLHSIYYDTSDNALRGAGIALRLRRDRRRWIQTVKKSAAKSLRVGLSTPIEVEHPVRGRQLAVELIPNDDLREELIGLIAGRPLIPVVETRFRRTNRVVQLPGGGAAELAIDVGDIIGGGRTAQLREAEFELTHGAVSDLFVIARTLLRSGPVRFSDRSKSARGKLLAETGAVTAPLEPRHALEMSLSNSQTVEDALVTILNEALAQVSANIPVTVYNSDPEGPHQLRVGLRRLRSALSACRAALGEAERAALAGMAREIGAKVGALRDLDVLADEGLTEAENHGAGEPGFLRLRSALENQRGVVRADVQRWLAGASPTAFVFDLAGYVEGRGWQNGADSARRELLSSPAVEFGATLLDKRWKAVTRYGRRLEKLKIDERHEMRKEIKKLRYMIDFFGDMYSPKRTARFVQALKKLQTAFGALNDSAVAEALLTAPGVPWSKDPSAQRAAGRVIGHALATADRLWPETKGHWKALVAIGPFWR